MADTFIFPFEISPWSWTHFCGPLSFFKNFLHGNARTPAIKQRPGEPCTRVGRARCSTLSILEWGSKRVLWTKKNPKLRHRFAKTFFSLFSANIANILRAKFERSYFYWTKCFKLNIFNNFKMLLINMRSEKCLQNSFRLNWICIRAHVGRP